MDEVCEQLKMSPQELREDISVLNVVNFGGGAYVIYAEVLPSGEIEVDPEPYSDTFDRPARLLPIEAKALVAAIDLLNLAQPELGTAREKVVAALGHDPVEEGLQITSPTVVDDVAQTVERAVHERRLLEFEYWDEQQLLAAPGGAVRAVQRLAGGLVVRRRVRSRPRAAAATSGSTASRASWRSTSTSSAAQDLDPIADIGGWPRTGTVEGSRVAHVWISPEQARWAREKRTVVAELERRRGGRRVPFKGIDYLVKEILKEAGDAAVLEPADAREAVLAAAERLLAPSS